MSSNTPLLAEPHRTQDQNAHSHHFSQASGDDESPCQRHNSIPSTNPQGASGRPLDATINISTSQRMISATWGSVLTSLLSTPLDVVRVRLQSQALPTLTPQNLSRFPAYATNFKDLPADLGVKACCREVFFVGDNAEFCLAGNGTHSSGTAAAECAVEETQRRTFNSTLDGLRKIARNEGVWTLWRGLSPTLLMAIPANVIYFTGYDWLRYDRASPVKKYAGDKYSPLVAGSVARVAAAIAVSPIEMFRTRMQASSGSSTVFKDTLVGLHRMTQSQGYTSLWRGLTLTMWRDVPFSGIYWWGYEAVRNSLTDLRERSKGNLPEARSITSGRSSQISESHTTTFVDSFVSGATSGAIAAFVTTPFDVGKTRQQVFRHAGDDSNPLQAAEREAARAVGKTIPEELSMPRFLLHIFREEGTSGLFKGWGARCLKVAPACAIMISSYEIGKKWAQTANRDKEEKATV